MDFIFSRFNVQKTLPFCVYIISPHYSEYLNYYLILLLSIISLLFFLLFFFSLFFRVYELFSGELCVLCCGSQLVHCPHSWLSNADLIGLVPRS